jgi:hypothetical protein
VRGLERTGWFAHPVQKSAEDYVACPDTFRGLSLFQIQSFIAGREIPQFSLASPDDWVFLTRKRTIMEETLPQTWLPLLPILRTAKRNSKSACIGASRSIRLQCWHARMRFFRPENERLQSDSGQSPIDSSSLFFKHRLKERHFQKRSGFISPQKVSRECREFKEFPVSRALQGP